MRISSKYFCKGDLSRVYVCVAGDGRGGERGWGGVDYESDQSYHGLITLSQRRGHEKRSDYGRIRKRDWVISGHFVDTEYCYWVFLISLILNLLG